MIRRPPRSTLFPSTPLFRSFDARVGERDRLRCPAERFRFRHGQPKLLEHRAAGLDRRDREAEGDEAAGRSEEHTSELQSPCNLVCRLLLEKKKTSDQDYRSC